LSAGKKRALAASRDNHDRLYRDVNNSLTILKRSHHFTMADLDNHRHKLQESQDEILRLRQLVSSKDSVIKDLRTSKRSVVQELEAARLAIKVAEDTSTTLKA
jgi:predicted  nucleic acid-binding Zn-ribbon protein